MSGLIKIAFIALSSSLFVSETVGRAFLYGCCLVNMFREQKYLLILSVISVLFDVYHSSFAGISFISLAVVTAVAEKFESELGNLSLFVRLYYLLFILCGAETVNSLVSLLAGGAFNFYSHVVVVAEALFFYYLFERLGNYVKR